MGDRNKTHSAKSHRKWKNMSFGISVVLKLCVFVYLFWGTIQQSLGIKINRQSSLFVLIMWRYCSVRRQDHFFITFTSVSPLLLLLESFFNITELVCASHLHHHSSFPGGLVFCPICKVHDSAAVKHAVFKLSHVPCACVEGVLPCAVHPVDAEPPGFEAFMIQKTNISAWVIRPQFWFFNTHLPFWVSPLYAPPVNSIEI